MLRQVVSRARLMLGMSLASLALVVFCPSVGAAVPSPFFFPPELTSGSFHLGRGFAGGVDGHASFSTPSGDAMSLGFQARSFLGANPTETGASANEEQFFSSSGSITRAGQTYGTVPCGVQGPTLIGPCSIVIGFYRMHADPPPFDGNSTVTVPGTYSLTMAGVGVLFPSDQPGESFTGFSGSFTGSGPASLTFVWLPSISLSLPPQWLFDSGDAEIHPTPEPATLLLWGTGAAGLGLARWYRRRASAREHAA